MTRRTIRPGDPITDREKQILRLIATGATGAEIGRALFVAESTVKTHVGRLYTRLGARNAAHAVALGYQTGILGADDAGSVS